MTRIVVYDREDHEPITVVEIPISYMREVEEGRRRRITLMYRMDARISARVSSEPPREPVPLSDVCTELFFERVAGGGRGHDTLFWFLYPSSGEQALRIKSVFLPGQIPEVRRAEMEAEFRGMLLGLRL